MKVTLTFKVMPGGQQVDSITLRIDTADMLDALSKALVFAAGNIAIPVIEVKIAEVPAELPSAVAVDAPPT